MRALMLFALLLAWLPINGQTAATGKSPTAEFIASHAAEQDFSGTILIRKNHRTIYRKSFGLANRQFRVANGNQTRYKIASITKAFTAALILQLVEQGEIDLQHSFGRYLPAYSGPAGELVSVHQLLNHTSGMANFDTVKDFATALAHGLGQYQRPYDSDQLLSEFCSQELVTVPGSTFDYNNADYIVLGKIIEQHYGKSYAAVLKAQILDPLQMRHSGMLQQHQVIEQLADTYFLRPDIKAIVPDLPVYPENWYAAGSMYSTVDDLAVFADALFDGKLIKPATLALMLEAGLDDYGYGAWTYTSNLAGKPQRIFKRPGQIMGAQTQLYRLVDSRISVIILSNVGNTDLDEFVAQIGKRILAEVQQR